MGSYTPPPTIGIIVTPGVDRSRVAIYVSSALLGHTAGVPAGHLAIRMVAGDLVGLTPVESALKALHHIVRTLEHVASTQRRPEAPAPPDGGHGGECVDVPLPGLQPSTLT